MLSINESNNSCLSSSSASFKIIAAIRGASALTSLVFSISAVVINVLSKKYLVPLHRMVLYFSVSCVINGVVRVFNRVDYFVTNDATKIVCIAVGFADEYAGWTTVLAVLSIAYNLCMEVMGRANEGRRAQLFWMYLIFTFPLTFCWIPFIHLAYGQSADWPWCCIRRRLEDCTVFTFATVLDYALWSVPAVIVISAIFVLYSVTVVIVIRKKLQWDPLCCDPEVIKKKRKMEREVATLVLPALAFFIVNILPFINSISEQTGKERFALWVAYAILPQLSGGMGAFFMTVDKDSCSKLVRYSLFRRGGAVKEYAVQAVVGGTGTIPRNNQS